jgi:UDP-N-acetylmuramoyl-tripeptide--D-alanyl-D-alanine ligase
MAEGKLITCGVSDTAAVTHICTDSREADGNTLFCAMRGERVDGHDYIPKASSLGCSAFLCERIPENLPALTYAAILVEDTEAALGRLAAAYRAETLSNLPITAVTGSVGKTTTKEMLSAVLSSACRVYKKEGNFNSTIGLPLSCLEISPAFEEAVLEMGMSGLGEIAAMTAAVRPDIALIANVGSSHLERLGSRENIARAKLEIAEGLREGGVLLVNGDEPLLADAEQAVTARDARVLRLSLAGAANADFTVSRMSTRDGGMVFDLSTPHGEWTDLWVPAMGEHLVWAAAFAAAVGQLRGLDAGQVRRGLASYRPAAMRQNSRVIGGVTILEDCYNAAPESMGAALKVLRMTPAARRIAVLGDMKELGENTEALHRGVGAEVVRQGVDALIAVGELGRFIAAGAAQAGMPPEAIRAVDTQCYEEAAAMLAEETKDGDCILFKASRAMALEKMAEALASKLKK